MATAADDGGPSAEDRYVDVVVVGAGTAGNYAAATVAQAGYDVVVLERKSEADAGHIACGDALKGSSSFPDAIDRSYIEPAITNPGVDHGRFEIPSHDTVLEIPVPGGLAVVDRWAYGQGLIEGAMDAGVDFSFDSVVQSVVQTDTGRVAGVRATTQGEPTTYRGDVVIDGGGAMSIVQDEADFSETTFDTNVDYSQFCSAYREIVEVPEEVPWDDALVFKPTERAAGYLWYFPRTGTEINAGLGFQMNEPPMKLVNVLKEDLAERPEFDGATVKDKLGAALPTRRPYDSAVAPGFMAVGDAAGHVNPTTGGGIAGAAFAGAYAGEQAVNAIEAGTVDEPALWTYNERVMDRFGARYAALDVYNIFSTATDVDELMGLLASLPGEKISEALYGGTTSIGLGLKLRIGYRCLGHLGLIRECYQAKRLADELLEHYEDYPHHPSEFDEWQAERDELMDRIYETTGAEAKY